MTPNRLTAIAFRWSISAVFTLWLFAPNAQAQNAATAINGVYNGTYTCAIGPRTLKLSLLASGNGSLTGVFTFYLPPTSHTEAFSYSLNGTFDAASGKFKLNPVKWETPPPGGYVMVGMDGAFDPGTGQVAGKITYGSCGAFQATRDQAASANVASRIAPQKAAGAAQPVPKTAAPAEQPQNVALNKKPCDFVTKSDAESILGATVEARRDGPYECWFAEPGFTSTAPKNKQVSLSIWYSASPDPSQYAVMRKNIADHKDAAAVMKEMTDFADAAIWTWTSGWGGSLDAFNGGTIQVQVTISGLPEDAALQNAKALAARVFGRAGGTGYVYLETPKRNASVSAPQKAAGTAQPLPKTVARAATAAPAPQPPTSLAAPPSKATAASSQPSTTNGIVHEPKSYWYDYRSKIIQQVFDGDFGRDLDSSTQFRILFNSYVESFSKNCHAYLPARHEAVTLSQVTTKKDGHGNVVSQQQGQSWTVDVDSRFVPEYRAYAASLGSTSGETLAGALSVMSGRVSASAYFDPGTDIDKFFETETCQSAAMRQLTENLLRAAKGGDPLQDAGDPNIVRVCVPANLVENHSWKNPPPGGKMETFKNAVRKTLRDQVRSKGLENPLFWVVERPANGTADLFDTFDPATTDPRRLVEFGGAGRNAHCTIGSYALTLPINP